ncbi:hypothetical protein SNEBB_010369 [Seison nebaliae]|nr:hypothetical protein SNEBB_010369 [Seison nebaliae]
MTEEDANKNIYDLYPNLKGHKKLLLPTKLCAKDAAASNGIMKLSDDCMTVSYVGETKGDSKNAATIKANHSIPLICGIFYYEVKIEAIGNDGYIGIGLCSSSAKMHRLPGWDPESYGYHADDGNSFCQSGTGVPYGPTFKEHDVVGCCVNLFTRTAFFTKNGNRLGTVFKQLPLALRHGKTFESLYPTVGLQTTGESATINFGNKPFIFDIKKFRKDYRHLIRKNIMNTTSADEFIPKTLRNLVTNYLTHSGFCQTAQKFAKQAKTPLMESVESMKNRHYLKRLCIFGRYSDAIGLTKLLYPTLLEENLILAFRLKTQQFIEILNGTDPGYVRLEVKDIPQHYLEDFNGDQNLTMREIVNLINSNLNRSGNKSIYEVAEDIDYDMINSNNNSVTTITSPEKPVKKKIQHCAKCCIQDNGTIPQVNEHCDIRMCQFERILAEKTNLNELIGDDPVNDFYQHSVAIFDSLLDLGRDINELVVEIEPTVSRELFTAIMHHHTSVLSLPAYLQRSNVDDDKNGTSVVAPKKRKSNWKTLSDGHLKEEVWYALDEAILHSNNMPREPPVDILIAHTLQLKKLIGHHNLPYYSFLSKFDHDTPAGEVLSNINES